MYGCTYMYIIIIALSQKRAIYAPLYLIFSIDIVAFACYLSVRRCEEVLSCVTYYLAGNVSPYLHIPENRSVLRQKT